MRAISVPLSTILTLGVRFDVAPYLEIATKTPEALRIELQASLKRSYRKKARMGLAHIRNVKEWNRLHKAEDIKVIQ